jgi:hypothetical protein
MLLEASHDGVVDAVGVPEPRSGNVISHRTYYNREERYGSIQGDVRDAASTESDRGRCLSVGVCLSSPLCSEE